MAIAQVVADNPAVGVGVRGVEQAANDRGYIDRNFVHAHFYGLDVLVSTGVVGLTAYLVALGGFLVAILKAARGGLISPPAAMAAALTLFGAMNPIYAHWTTYSSYAMSVAWLSIGLALPLLVEQRRGIKPSDRQSTPDTPPASDPASPAM